jgi:hypothetical protein
MRDDVSVRLDRPHGDGDDPRGDLDRGPRRMAPRPHEVAIFGLLAMLGIVVVIPFVSVAWLAWSMIVMAAEPFFEE